MFLCDTILSPRSWFPAASGPTGVRARRSTRKTGCAFRPSRICPGTPSFQTRRLPWPSGVLPSRPPTTAPEPRAPGVPFTRGQRLTAPRLPRGAPTCLSERRPGTLADLETEPVAPTRHPAEVDCALSLTVSDPNVEIKLVFSPELPRQCAFLSQTMKKKNPTISPLK